jgi:hypothetical protein
MAFMIFVEFLFYVIAPNTNITAAAPLEGGPATRAEVDFILGFLYAVDHSSVLV